MPTRYILATTPQDIESRFNLSLQGCHCEAQPKQTHVVENNYNITPGQFAPIITDRNPHQIQLFRFGLTPFWAKSDMLLPTARSEGDYNQSDNPKIKSAAGIILKKAFRKPIRSQRCIVIASAFIEGISNFSKSQPHVIYLRNHQNPFPIAGIWDTWHSPSGDTINSFCIITTSANSLLQKIGSLRMPVILTYSQAKKWINPNTGLTTITQMLKKYDSNLMNAYPINPAINNSNENDKKLIRPTGPKLLIEETHPQLKFPYTSGFHQSKKANRSNEPTTTIAERLEIAKANENQSKN